MPGFPNALVLSIHDPSFPIDGALLAGRDVSQIKLQLNSDVWLLDVIFYYLRQRLSQPLIVGGEFNYSRLLDEPRPAGNAEFFDRILREGFVSLHRRFHGHDEQTFFHPNRRSHQLDYLYADRSIAARTTGCYVVARAEVEDFSDHSPFVADVSS